MQQLLVTAVSNERTDTMIGTRRGPLAVLERIVLATASMLVSINVCTGFPLLALWIGSQAANASVFTGIITAILSLAALSALGVAALTRLSARYDKVTGRPPPTRQPRPWYVSMRAARTGSGQGQRGINPIELIAVLTVVAAFVALEIFFFFIAGPVQP